MEKETLLQAGIDLSYLSSLALFNKIPPKERLEQIDIKNVYSLAKKHSMTSMVYISLQKCNEAYPGIVDKEALSAMRKSHLRLLKRLVRFDFEREELMRYLDSEGIWYITLKGIVLAGYYPTLGMRQMADNDILVDPKGAKRIKKFMKSRGYDVYSYGGECHDIYVKGNIAFEIHRALVGRQKHLRVARTYYSNVKERLISDGRSAHRFSPEDFYVYFIYHAYKHFSVAGTGMRTLMDISVFWNKMSDKLDFEYIKGELSSLGISEYEEVSRRLALLYFSEEHASGKTPSPSGDDLAVFEYYVSSGTFGNNLQRMKNYLGVTSEDVEVSRLKKLGYLISRTFPGISYYRSVHPIAYRFIVTIPVLWAIRIIRGFRKHDAVKVELGQLKSIK